GIVAQELFHRLGRAPGLAPQQLHLIRMSKQRQGPVADEVHRRLMPCHQEENGHGNELLLAEAIPLIMGVDERAQEVGAGISAALQNNAAHVFPDLARRIGGPAGHFFRPIHVQGRGQGVGPRAVQFMSKAAAKALDHARNLGRSAAGTPSISAMTITGSGKAYASMRSIPPSFSPGWSSSCAISTTRGTRPSTVLGVNALLTSRRRRVWSGGSRSSIHRSAMS